MWPASSDRPFRSVLRPACIRRLIFLTVCWYPYWQAVNLTPMATQFLSDIQAQLTRSRMGGLGDLVIEI